MFADPDQFVFIHPCSAKDFQGDFFLQIPNSSLLVHKFELEKESYLSTERMLSRKAA